ncbi:MAG: GTP pyrophosphokinase [Thiomicrospira sp.]|nr:MAG: GTP pyrophosphokinase [Thiomicrospira sp.]
MSESEIDTWLDQSLPDYRILTNTVVSILESLLQLHNVDYLTVTGRVKDKNSIKEKIKRKTYTEPKEQLTDLSGVRIIAYFESDVDQIASIIENSFEVVTEHSLPKNHLLETNQIGYRSIHYVCKLGSNREGLPEFSGLKGLMFEFQIRTVLQHAWAELAHDRNYKFSGKLPKDIERKLYLYAGMLEIADKGFDELSSEIDSYILTYTSRTQKGDFDIEINSISLPEFIENWATENAFPLEPLSYKLPLDDLISELEQMGIRKLDELKNIIPENYIEASKSINYETTIYGLVRDWLLLHDFERYHDEVSYNWNGIDYGTWNLMEHMMDVKTFKLFKKKFDDHPFLPDEYDDIFSPE